MICIYVHTSTTSRLFSSMFHHDFLGIWGKTTWVRTAVIFLKQREFGKFSDILIYNLPITLRIVKCTSFCFVGHDPWLRKVFLKETMWLIKGATGCFSKGLLKPRQKQTDIPKNGFLTFVIISGWNNKIDTQANYIYISYIYKSLGMFSLLYIDIDFYIYRYTCWCPDFFPNKQFVPLFVGERGFRMADVRCGALALF